jgi:PhoH-like ATPase
MNKQKLYILDTNVLLSDPSAILKFDEHSVAIPMVVLVELDKQKSSDRDIARDARAVIRRLESLIREDDPLVGVELPTGGLFTILPNPPKDFEGMEVTCNDDVIINTALYAQEYYANFSIGREKAYEVTLVTNDLCMRLKAKGAGLLNVQEYRNDIVVQDPDLLPKGYMPLPNGWFSGLDDSQVIAKSCGRTLIDKGVIEEFAKNDRFAVNDWLINADENIYAQLKDLVTLEDGKEYYDFTFKDRNSFWKRKVVGIEPKDTEQAIALDALLDPEIDIVVINGAAGSGKTLLAMAAASEMITGKRGYKHSEVIVSRSMDSQFAEIGFLPGNETDKTKPWLAGVVDNMEVIARASNNINLHPNQSIISGNSEEDEGTAFIRVSALNFMRGRSISRKIFVIDEVQNLTSTQIKTILSRAGEDCKVVIMGSLAQIDSTIVSPRTSALTYATDKLHGVPFAKVITLSQVHRSRLAEFIETNF